MSVVESDGRQTRPEVARGIHLRTTGRKMGPVMRLIDPWGIGAITAPFVFLDDASIPPGPAGAMHWHPHSGIGTLTIIMSGRNHYRETTGKEGNVEPDGVEWMSSGKGVWHAASAIGDTNLIGYQVWMLLPPKEELSPSNSRHFNAQEIPVVDDVRVIIGRWEGIQGPVPYENEAVLLDVRRKKGERFYLRPEPGHELAWIAVHSGSLRFAGEEVGAGELVVFEDGDDPIVVEASADARFLAAHARRTKTPLFIGSSSVHSSAEALAAGQAEIARIELTLR